MLKTYFKGSFESTPEENFYVSYIMKKIKEIHPDMCPLAVQKVVVDVVKKLNLPVLTFWYLHGETSMFPPDQVIVPTSEEIFSGASSSGFEVMKKEEIDEQISQSSPLFAGLDFPRVKKKQYTLYKNEFYQAMYELDELTKSDLDHYSKDFIDLLTRVRTYLPAEKEYGPIYEILFKYNKSIKQLLLKKSSLNNATIVSLTKDILKAIECINPLFFNNEVDADRLKGCIFPENAYLELSDFQSQIDELLQSSSLDKLIPIKLSTETEVELHSHFSDLIKV